MPTVPMRETAFVTLDASGNGTAKVGPISAREVWHPSNVAVSANAGATLEAQCNIHVGLSATPSTYRDGTVNGSAGDSTDKVNADTVRCGEYVWAVWSGGNVGSRAVLTVTGTKDV
jgi:hypothetical protein